MSAEPDLVGKVVAGRYRIERQLGAGAMGAVYEATQLSMDRRVALKLIHPHIASSADVAARFEREMRATSRIEHPHTIAVFDYGADDNGQLFLAMEFLEGQPLSTLIEALGRLPLPRLLHIASQIVRALGAAHAEGITHRDLKPDNIMLVDRYDEHDVVKVLDFGIARFMDDDHRTRMTAEGAVVGTPIYMSPEQAQGQEVGPPSDFYSLGVMLYEMAVGRPPFVSPTVAGLLVEHAIETPPKPSSFAPLSPALEALILRLLAKNPAERPSGPTVLAELAAASHDELALAATGTAPVVAARVVSATALAATGVAPVAVGPTAQATKKFPWVTVTVVAVVLLTTGGIALQQWSAQSAAARRARARLDQLLVAAGDPLAPVECRAHESAVVERLTKAATALAGSTVGKPRPQDRDAARLLDEAPAPNAESWALTARARLVVDPESGSRAEQAAERALALCPRFAWAENLVGGAAQRDKKFADAKAAYERAIDLAPDYLAPRFNLGLLALRANDAGTALAAFDFVLQKDPLRAGARLARGQAHLMLEHIDAAIEDLEQAALRQPDSADAQLLLGRAHQKAGHALAAREAFCKAKTLGADVGQSCP